MEDYIQNTTTEQQLSASQKKRLKKKLKQKNEVEVENENEKKPPPTIIESNAPNNDPQKKKKKKPEPAKEEKKPKNAAYLKKVREALELKKAEEERLRQEQLELERQFQEEERRLAEEERLLEEKRQLKKQQKKEQLESMRKQGLPVTRQQREQAEKVQKNLLLLKQQGFVVPDVNTEKSTSKGNYYVHKVSKKKKTETIKEPVSAPADKVVLEAKETDQTIESEEVLDNWEDELSDAEAPPPQITTINKTLEEPKKPKKTPEEPKKNNFRYRSPVICVLGHVDTGKTKILDKLRMTNVQSNEAGGITQQIGVTNVDLDSITARLKTLDYFRNLKFVLPGLMIIDTPGHESFRNLRIRGSSLCDIAILVVDVMQGLEQQTIESVQLLKKQRLPFIVALNKIDRLFNYASENTQSVRITLTKQAGNVQAEFTERFNFVKLQFAEKLSLNIGLFYDKSVNFVKNNVIPVVPTSAHTGDGIYDLVAMIYSTCSVSNSKLLLGLERKPDYVFDAVIMEVKVVTGMGVVLDVILINGQLKEGDSILFATMNEGCVCGHVRAIYTTKTMTDLRAANKNVYDRHASINESCGVRISLSTNENEIITQAVPGTALVSVPCLREHMAASGDESGEEAVLSRGREIITNSMSKIMSSFNLADVGVYVQASTLGSLEALLEFLSSSKIPYFAVNIGTVHRKDVIKASVMHQHDPNYACILAFDVKVEPEALTIAKKENVRIFTADIIYHLFDDFIEYTKECNERKKRENASKAVFPAVLRILPQYIFNKKNPIVCGVLVEEGTLRVNTPLAVLLEKEKLRIGRVASIESNGKQVEVGKTGQEVSIKIVPETDGEVKQYGQHFTHESGLVSWITRDSIDVMKSYFRDEMSTSDWKLVQKLKKTFEIL